MREIVYMKRIYIFYSEEETHLKNSTEKILAEIRLERERQLALTRSDLEKEYVFIV